MLTAGTSRGTLEQELLNQPGTPRLETPSRSNDHPMSGLPDPPRGKTEPTKGFKNGCLAALFWAAVAALPVAVILYFITMWLSEQAAETRLETQRPAAVEPGEAVEESSRP